VRAAHDPEIDASVCARVERQRPWLAGEDASEHEGVEMDVEIQCAAESLNHDDGAAVAVLDAGVTRPVAQDTKHAPHQDAGDRAAEIVIPREAVPQPVRQAQHPRSDGYVRQHVIDETRRALGDRVFESLIENKTIEWDAYRRHVSDFEMDRYLAVL